MDQQPSGMLTQRQPAGDLLKQAADKVEKTVKPEMRRTYDAIIVAGMKLMWGSADTHQMMVEYLQSIKQDPGSLAKIVAHGIIKMISIILQERLKKIDDPAAKAQTKDEFMGPSAPAAFVLATQVLDYLNKRMGIPVDRAVIAQVTRAVTQGIYEFYDVTPEQIDQSIQSRASSSGQQPAAKPAKVPANRPPGGM